MQYRGQCGFQHPGRVHQYHSSRAGRRGFDPHPPGRHQRIASLCWCECPVCWDCQSICCYHNPGDRLQRSHDHPSQPDRGNLQRGGFGGYASRWSFLRHNFHANAFRRMQSSHRYCHRYRGSPHDRQCQDPCRVCCCAGHLRGHSQGDGYRQRNCLYKYDSRRRNDRAGNQSSACHCPADRTGSIYWGDKIVLPRHDPEWRDEHHDDHSAEQNTHALHRRRFDR